MASIKQGAKLEVKIELVLRFFKAYHIKKGGKGSRNEELFYDSCEGGVLPKSSPKCALNYLYHLIPGIFP